MCWKGISTAQAVELTIWERVFEQCLVPQFESHMRRNIVAELGALRGTIPILHFKFPDCYRHRAAVGTHTMNNLNTLEPTSTLDYLLCMLLC